MEKKLKHLEFAQNIITRMNVNSFMIKGWSVTLVSALFALAAQNANTHYVLIAFVPVFTFWLLDGYFLSQERQYRGLYNKVAGAAENDIDFNLNATAFNNGRNRWECGVFSTTLLVFHGVLLGVVLIVMFLLPKLGK